MNETKKPATISGYGRWLALLVAAKAIIILVAVGIILLLKGLL
ncbi:MAG: hypothetical protein ACWA5X_06285 [bacterium]